ncbi:MAG TPA: hypothetical protein VGL81_36180 [Polyangiaceae bacterium]|jgi:hypothetical protein
MRTTIIGSGFLIVACACSGTPGTSGGSGAGEAADHPATVTETIVRLSPDAPPDIETKEVPWGIQRRLAKTGTQVGIHPDISEVYDCYDSAVLTLYDGYYDNGNVVCFYGKGSMSLSGLTFTAGESVTGNINSMWTGDSAGSLSEHCGLFVCPCDFAASTQYEYPDVPGYCTDGTTVDLDNN